VSTSQQRLAVPLPKKEKLKEEGKGGRAGKLRAWARGGEFTSGQEKGKTQGQEMIRPISLSGDSGDNNYQLSQWGEKTVTGTTNT